MVTLIFEGADNLGKSTIINKIVSNFRNTRDITLMHSKGPQPSEGEDPFSYQHRAFTHKAMKITSLFATEQAYDTLPKNLVIMDRAWFGEYVYGQLYRKANPEEILGMIAECNNIISYTDGIAIHLTASPEFILNHDDNLSITSSFDSSKRLQSIKKEVELFKECFDKTTFKTITVNVEGEDGEYRNIDDIYNDIISGINKFGIKI